LEQLPGLSLPRSTARSGMIFSGAKCAHKDASYAWLRAHLGITDS
jgi:hypothetical protein